MAISMKSLRRAKATEPPRVLIYGPEKVGKTTLASEFPNPVFLQTEEGAGNLELDSFGKLATFGDVMDAVASLYNEDHGYQTVVVDSVTALQPMIWKEACERGDEKGNKKQRIEDFGYGKGYVYAVGIWQEFIEGLNALRIDKGMTIVLIAHSKIDRFDDPETVSYSRFDIDLHDKARDLLKRDSDAILLVKPDVVIKAEDAGFNKSRAIGSGGRNVFMHTDSRPAFVGGNRYGMPEKMLFERGKGYAQLAPYLPCHQPQAAATAEKAAA